MKAEAESRAGGYEEGWGEGEEALKEAAALNKMTAQRIAHGRRNTGGGD
jgi:hypothetical protein